MLNEGRLGTMWSLVGLAVLVIGYLAYLFRRRRLMELRLPRNKGRQAMVLRVQRYAMSRGWDARIPPALIDVLVISKNKSGDCALKCDPSGLESPELAIRDFEDFDMFPEKEYTRIFVTAKEVPWNVVVERSKRGVFVINTRSLDAFTALDPTSVDDVHKLLVSIGDTYRAEQEANNMPPRHSQPARNDPPTVTVDTLPSVSTVGTPDTSASDAVNPAAEIKRYLETGRTSLQNRDPQTAMTAFQAVIALDPRHVGALSGLAAAFNQQGKTEEAVAAVRSAIEIAPKNAGLYVQLAQLLNKQSLWEAAAAAFQAAVALDPKIAGAHNALDAALKQHGKANEAIAAVRAAIEITPKNAQLHVHLGQLLLSKKDTREAAVAAFQAARALDPKHPGALSGLASALSQQGRGEEAIDVLRTATSIWPDNVGLHVRLGQLLEEHHQLAAAAVAFRAAASIDVSNPSARAGLRRVRNPAKIFELFRRALQSPNEIAVLDELSAELDISRDELAALIRFALNPSESDVESIARTPVEHELLLTIVRAAQRQNYWLANGVTAPLERLQVAAPSTDVLGEPASHESWVPAQWLSSFLLRKTHAAHRAAVVVSMRDEGPYVLEWVAHYRVLGFDTIFVYANDNVDGSEGLLRELANCGVITYVENQLDKDHLHHPQKKAYAHALHLMPELWEHEWVLFADADEFLVPNESYNFQISALIDDAVSRFPERSPSAICFNWLWYVSGFNYSYEPKPLFRRFQHAVGKRGMKSLVRLRDIFSMHMIHFPEFDPEGFLVRSDFTRLEKTVGWKKTLDPVFASGQLNHYWNKSFEEFSIKKARGDAAGDRDKGWMRDFKLFFSTNAKETSDNYAPTPEALIVAVEAEMEKLAALPEVKPHLEEINRRFPKLLERFDRDGGLRAIYENTRAATSGRSRPSAAVQGTPAAAERE